MANTISTRFTEQAQEVAYIAAEVIKRYDHNMIDTEHLLLALIEYPNGIASKVLNNLNVNIGRLTEQIDMVLRANNQAYIFGEDKKKIFITRRVKRIIDFANSEAEHLADDQISSEHIFLSIFCEKNTPVSRVLKRSNLKYETIKSEILRIRQDRKPDKVFKEQVPDDFQPLRIFLCHSSSDKPKVRELYQQLRKDGLSPWLDEEDLLPGFDWQIEIPKAVQNSDVVIVCLSKDSVTKAGYVQKEIKQALDVADEKPEGTIFIIPLKLEECEIPKRLSRWQWVNFYSDSGYERLLRSLKIRAEGKNKG